MADPTVKLVFAGNSAEAERVMTGLERKVDALENKLKNVGRGSKSSFEGMEAALAGSLSKMASLAAAGSIVQGVFAKMTEKSQEFHDKIGQNQKNQLPEETKLQIATGMNAEAIKSMMPQLRRALFKTPAMSLVDMTTMQTEIAGAGFADADVNSGAAASAMLRVRAGMGTFGKDSEPVRDSAKAISSLLAAQGADMNAAGIERVGMRTAALAAKTNLAFGDLKQLSQAAGALSQLGVDESRMMAAFSVTAEAGGAMVGATGLKNIGLRLGTAGGDKEREQLLKSIGLTPADVAIAKGGVDFTSAGEKLRTALGTKSETEKNAFFSRFFGGDAVASAATLFSDAGFAKFKERTGIAENAQQEMGKRLELFETSRYSVGRRNELRAEFAAYDEAAKKQTWSEYNEKRTADFMSDREKQSNPFGRAGIDLVYGMGGTLDYINRDILRLDAGAPGVRRFAGDISGMGQSADWAEVAKKQLESMERQEKLLEEQNRLLNRKEINRNGQAE